jgi:hypothetical protein
MTLTKNIDEPGSDYPPLPVNDHPSLIASDKRDSFTLQFTRTKNDDNLVVATHYGGDWCNSDFSWTDALRPVRDSRPRSNEGHDAD